MRKPDFRLSLGKRHTVCRDDFKNCAYGEIDIVHTIVSPMLGGRGYGSRLVRSALDYARDNGLKVIPSCSFVGVYLERHPEYKALLFK